MTSLSPLPLLRDRWHHRPAWTVPVLIALIAHGLLLSLPLQQATSSRRADGAQRDRTPIGALLDLTSQLQQQLPSQLSSVPLRIPFADVLPPPPPDALMVPVPGAVAEVELPDAAEAADQESPLAAQESSAAAVDPSEDQVASVENATVAIADPFSSADSALEPAADVAPSTKVIALVPEQQSAVLEVWRDAEVAEAGEQRDWLQRQEFRRIDAEVLASLLMELKLERWKENERLQLADGELKFYRDGEQLILVRTYRS